MFRLHRFTGLFILLLVLLLLASDTFSLVVPERDPSSPFRFTVRKTPDAYSFHVDGSKLPLISEAVGDIGNTWAGHIPVNPDDPSRAFWFWLFPHNTSSYGGAADNLIIWFPSGPGVSSARDALQQLGPVLMPKNDQGSPTFQRNPYSWAQIGHLLFIESPLAAGFSIGKPNITDDEGLARELVGFLDGFIDTFPDYKTKRIYLASQGAGGLAATYLANALLRDRPQLNYKGLIYLAPFLAASEWTQDVPAVKFFQEHRDILPVRPDDLAFIQKQADKLNLNADSVEAMLTFPPGPVVPAPNVITSSGDSIWVSVRNSVISRIRCFSQYDIFQKCPYPYDPFGFWGFEYPPTSRRNIFNSHPELRAALHADQGDPDFRTHKYYDEQYFNGKPDNTTEERADRSPLLANDPFAGNVWTNTTAPEINGRVLIIAGGLDFDKIALGLQLGIQNITWGGLRGFQERPSERLLVGGVDAGEQHEERGVKWALLNQAGNYAAVSHPEATLQLVQELIKKTM